MFCNDCHSIGDLESFSSSGVHGDSKHTHGHKNDTPTDVPRSHSELMCQEWFTLTCCDA